MFKRLLSDWFGPKYKSKVSSYMDNARALLRSRLNLRFNLNYFIVFIVYFVHLELFFFTLHVLKSFYSRINKPNIYNSIISILSSQNGLNDLFSSDGFYFNLLTTNILII